jgi:Lar family restriction alleviation protein
MADLKSCPFCGADNPHVETPVRHADGDDRLKLLQPYVLCMRCGGIGPSAQTKEAATQAWNRRPSLSTLQVQSEAVAWRFRYLNPPDRSWTVVTDKPRDEAGIECHPLYASPPASQADLREAVTDCTLDWERVARVARVGTGSRDFTQEIASTLIRFKDVIARASRSPQ